MKKLIIGFSVIALLSAIFSSCTIEKRLHQDGFHISWKNRHHAPSDLSQQNEITAIEEFSPTHLETALPNVYSVETITVSSNESTEPILLTKKTSLIQSKSDTIVPDQSRQQEEYFSNNYVSRDQPIDIQDKQLANWALGLGIGSVATPVWASILFFSIGAATGFSWALLGVSLIIGLTLFLALEITAITFAIRFLRRRGKDPEYLKYRSRAITGLILAGIYPALVLLNIIISIALI